MAIAGKVAPTYAGEWSESAAYQQHTYVTYNGDCYISIKPSTGIVPTNDEYWFLALKNVTQEQIGDIISGTTTVGNSASLGGETSEAWQTKLDNIQTTSRGTLSQAGWYRVAEYTIANTAQLKGHATNGCSVLISRPVYNQKGEEHEIKLMSTYYNGQKFVAISDICDTQLVTKIRYTSDGTNDYLEIYHNSTTSDAVLFTVKDCSDFRGGAWQAITPTLTSETVDGVTVTCTYDIPANASPVTDLDMDHFKVTLYKGKTEEEINSIYNLLHTNASDGEWYRALVFHDVAHSILGGGTWYLEGYRQNELYGWQRIICYSSYGTKVRKLWNGNWNNWIDDATTADLTSALANYLPLSGGVLSGNLRQVVSNDSVTHRIINSLRDVELIINNSGGFKFYDNTNGKAIITSNADGTNTFHGKATGQGNPVAIQSSAPSDTSALWVDTANKVIKAYIDGAWTQVS